MYSQEGQRRAIAQLCAAAADPDSPFAN
jgi:hypothetical protein